MQRKGRDLIGTKVIAKDTGEHVEDVDQLLFDPQTNQVLGLVVDKGGWFSDAKVIRMERIESIGDDAVIIGSKTSLEKASAIKGTIERIVKDGSNLTKTKIVTEGGKELGTISDVYFDANSGSVLSFEVSQGLVNEASSGRKQIAVSDIVKVGIDVTFVKDSAESALQAQSETQGLKGALNDAKAKAPGLLDQLKSKATEAKETIAAKTPELADKLRDNAAQAKEKLATTMDDAKESPQAQAASDKLHHTIDVGKTKTQEIYTQGKQRIETTKRDAALGHYVTVNILDRNDQILASRGDMITHELLDRAQQAGQLAKVVDNTSPTPVA